MSIDIKVEDGGSMDLRNVSILPKHYMASQPTRTEVAIFAAVKVSKLNREKTAILRC